MDQDARNLVTFFLVYWFSAVQEIYISDTNNNHEKEKKKKLVAHQKRTLHKEVAVEYLSVWFW